MKNKKDQSCKSEKEDVEYQNEHQKDSVNGNADASLAEKVRSIRMIMKIIPPPMIMRMSSATNVQKGSNWKRR